MFLAAFIFTFFLVFGTSAYFTYASTASDSKFLDFIFAFITLSIMFGVWLYLFKAIL